MGDSWDTLRNRLLAKKGSGFQADLARKMKVKPNTIQKYFDNERVPGLDQLDKIAKALDIKPWELIKPENEPEIADADLFKDIVIAWPKLLHDERQMVSNLAKSLLALHSAQKSADPKTKDKKSGS